MEIDATTRVADIMTGKVVVLSEEDNLSRVAEGLDQFSFRHIPVVDGAKLVGMLSQSDVLRSAVSKLDDNVFTQAREARLLEQTFVRDVMHSAVLTIRPEELVQTAAARMLDEGISALPVVSDAGDVIGIVTATDVLRLVARRRGFPAH
jgi:CBS domain-containing protein